MTTTTLTPPKKLSMFAALAIAAFAAPANADLGAHVPRGAMAIRGRDPRPAPIPTGPGGRLVYHGGRVISNVKVYQVLWGPNVWSRTANELAAFYTAVTNSEYFDWLGSQYDTAGRQSSVDGTTTSNQHIGRGSFGGKIQITPNDRSTTLTNEQIAAELSYQIAHGALPQPDVDAAGNVNALYMFDFPPGMTIWLDNAQSCVAWYAYHYTTVIGGKSVPYGVHPDFSRDCANAGFTLSTSVHSHELIEAVTDMEVGLGNDTQIGWNSDQDNGQEIGDLCNADATIAGYTVQTMWSNHDGRCVGASAFRLPLCNGTLAAPNCRPCSSVDDGAACNGATPRCETSQVSSKSGRCVACTDDAGCSGATPICDKSATSSADTCRACTAADCKGATPACVTDAADPQKGSCVACATNAECKDPEKPVCTAHACVAKETPRPPAADGGVAVTDGGAPVAPNGDTPGVDSGASDASCACSAIGTPQTGAGAVVFALGLVIVAVRRRR